MVLNIKRVREEKGMTQEQLAEKANVNRRSKRLPIL